MRRISHPPALCRFPLKPAKKRVDRLIDPVDDIAANLGFDVGISRPSSALNADEHFETRRCQRDAYAPLIFRKRSFITSSIASIRASTPAMLGLEIVQMIGNMAWLHWPCSLQRANHAPLLFGQSMRGQQWAKTLHHFFSGAQQQHRQVAVQNSCGLADKT